MFHILLSGAKSTNVPPWSWDCEQFLSKFLVARPKSTLISAKSFQYMASCLQKMPISLLQSCVSYKFFILLNCIRIFNICLSFQCCPSGISKWDCKKKRPILHSSAAYQQPCCVTESDCFCVITSIYPSRAEHFSRRKKTIQHYYYHERMPFLILFDKRMGKSQVRKSCTLTKCKALLNALSRAWVLNLRDTKGLQGVREYGSELLSTSLHAYCFTIRKIYHHHLAINVISKTKLKKKISGRTEMLSRFVMCLGCNKTSK